MGVSNTQEGVSNTRPGVSNTLVGVSRLGLGVSSLALDKRKGYHFSRMQSNGPSIHHKAVTGLHSPALDERGEADEAPVVQEHWRGCV